MIQKEEKQLLLVDLSARLSYGVKINHIADTEVAPVTLIGIAKDMITLESSAGYSSVDVEDYRPYLFPLSSMNEEQKENYNNFFIHSLRGLLTPQDSIELFDWLNKNHFDYRGLIEKSLALDATNLRIYE